MAGYLCATWQLSPPVGWGKCNFVEYTCTCVWKLAGCAGRFGGRWEVVCLSSQAGAHLCSGPAGVDTRALTKRIREKGTLLGRLVLDGFHNSHLPFEDPSKRHLVKEVSLQVGVSRPAWTVGLWLWCIWGGGCSCESLAHEIATLANEFAPLCQKLGYS